ncbi:DUF3581 family protein [Granulosicoccus sp. 3-233]|uniref:DUF3581 family protein n=1 Tax=Granulosicoccus sp. 3-233 TaxID=3417969 RepID=UPI003D344D55
MDISRFITESDGAVSFEETQASAFAKGVAGDFNPIHDPQSKRFCVPGDLLFSVLLHRYGAARHTRVQFSGMLDGKTRMLLPPAVDGQADITDARDRALLSLSLDGERFTDQSFIAQLCEQYVRFSGQTFPDVLVPLMRSAETMINPARPMVIYRNMSIDLEDSAVALFVDSADGQLARLRDTIDGQLTLELADSDISVDGRKGQVQLKFDIEVAGRTIGTGEKNLVLSGLREYDEAAMQVVVDEYNQRRHAYQGV